MSEFNFRLNERVHLMQVTRAPHGPHRQRRQYDGHQADSTSINFYF